MKFERLNWGTVLFVFASILMGMFVFNQIDAEKLTSTKSDSILSSILTVNSIFSAILITYLFTRITWTKDRKLDFEAEAILISQKITEFRRILNILTTYYGVWNSDDKTKNLIDNLHYRHIDFYDFNSENNEVIDSLKKNKNFSEGSSVLYLAMVSLIKQRKNKNIYQKQEELYKDFQHKGTYNIDIIDNWLKCDIMHTISYWLDDNYQMIDFSALEKYKDNILSAASRINNKYQNYELNNALIRELAEDMGTFYLKELHRHLKFLRQGITSLNLIIVMLISFSLLFGILIPFILFLISFEESFSRIATMAIASINVSLITFFLLKFKFLIDSEVKWI